MIVLPIVWLTMVFLSPLAQRLFLVLHVLRFSWYVGHNVVLQTSRPFAGGRKNEDNGDDAAGDVAVNTIIRTDHSAGESPVSTLTVSMNDAGITTRCVSIRYDGTTLCVVDYGDSGVSEIVVPCGAPLRTRSRTG